MSVQYVDTDGDSWTHDPESDTYYNRHAAREMSLSELRSAYGPLAVREEGTDRLIPEEDYRSESVLRRIIREELDRRFGPVTT